MLKPQGHFKGAAVLPLVLETVTVNNDSCDVKTSSVSRYLKGKRTATLIGGGAGGGTLIGGLAGGGKGALIGAALGAGARTAGAAYIEEKEIVLPAESTLSFKLTQPVTVKMSPHITVEVLLNLPLVGYLYLQGVLRKRTESGLRPSNEVRASPLE